MKHIDAAFARHKAAVLQFSGGKDSLACLYLLRPYWDRLTVMWTNTGDAFPETIEQMAAIRALVPHFQEVASDQPEQTARCGSPSDIVPVWSTEVGRLLDEGAMLKVQTPIDCCMANLWQPTHAATLALGATLIIRGQRNEEARKSPLRSGYVEGGIELLFPIENWTGDEVRGYLRESGVELPDHYRYVDSSLDCQHCTAYLGENAGKFPYMRERHPRLHAEVRHRLIQIREVARTELRNLEACCA